MEQHRVQQQLQEVLAEQAHVKGQLEVITEQLQLISKCKHTIQVSPQVNPKGSQGTDNPAYGSNAKTDKSRAPCQSQAPSAGESPRTMAEVVKTHVPKGHVMDSDGFISKDKRPHRELGRSKRPLVTGTKTRSKLRPAVNDIRIFATKFNPEETESDVKAFVEELLGDDCHVEKIRVRTTRHASFIVTAKRRHEQVLLDPNSWEEGVQVRKFYGRLGTSNENRTT